MNLDTELATACQRRKMIVARRRVRWSRDPTAPAQIGPELFRAVLRHQHVEIGATPTAKGYESQAMQRSTFQQDHRDIESPCRCSESSHARFQPQGSYGLTPIASREHLESRGAQVVQQSRSRRPRIQPASQTALRGPCNRVVCLHQRKRFGWRLRERPIKHPANVGGGLQCRQCRPPRRLTCEHSSVMGFRAARTSLVLATVRPQRPSLPGNCSTQLAFHLSVEVLAPPRIAAFAYRGRIHSLKHNDL